MGYVQIRENTYMNERESLRFYIVIQPSSKARFFSLKTINQFCECIMSG